MRVTRGRPTRRRAFGVDTNHRELIRALEARGASVTSTAGVGGGFPDAVIGYRGRNEIAEFKTATGKLREGQNTFALTWRGAPVRVLRTVADCEALLADMANRIAFAAGTIPREPPARGLGAAEFKRMVEGGSIRGGRKPRGS